MDKLSGLRSSIFDVNKFSTYFADLLKKQHISPRENHAFMTIFTGILVANQFENLTYITKQKMKISKAMETAFGHVFFYNFDTQQ